MELSVYKNPTRRPIRVLHRLFQSFSVAESQPDDPCHDDDDQSKHFGGCEDVLHASRWFDLPTIDRC
jgi:hypothetical protein